MKRSPMPAKNRRREIVAALAAAHEANERRWNCRQWAREFHVSEPFIRGIIAENRYWRAARMNGLPASSAIVPIRRLKYAGRTPTPYVHLGPALVRGAELQFEKSVRVSAEPGRIIIQAIGEKN